MATVEMYTKGYCGYCFAAKRLLAQRGIEYKEIPVDTDAELQQEMMKRSGRRTVPQIFINGESIGGYDDLVTLDKRGELEKMLASSG